MPKEKYEPPNPRRNHTILSSSISIVDPNKKEEDNQVLYGNNFLNGDSDLQYGWSELEITGSVKNLSPNLFNLNHLTVLYLNDNNLTNVPSQINELRNLTYLDLSSNKLRFLPPEIGDLITLRELHLNHNYIRTLPLELGRLFQLLVLGLKGNPLAPEILRIYSENNGTQKLLTHLLDNLMALACSLSNVSGKAGNPNILKAGLLLFGKDKRGGGTGQVKDESDQQIAGIDFESHDHQHQSDISSAARNLAAEFRKATSGLTVSTGSGLPSLVDDPLPTRTFIRVYEQWVTNPRDEKTKLLEDKMASFKKAFKMTELNAGFEAFAGVNYEDLNSEEYSTSQDFYNAGRMNYMTNFDAAHVPVTNTNSLTTPKTFRSSGKKDFFAVQPDTSDSEMEFCNVLPPPNSSKPSFPISANRAMLKNVAESKSDNNTISTTSETSATTLSGTDIAISETTDSEYVSSVEKKSALVSAHNSSHSDNSNALAPENDSKSKNDVVKKLDDNLVKSSAQKTLLRPVIKDDTVTVVDRSTPTSFTLMCYNILCDKYATRQLYAYCPTWAMAWNYRKERIKAHIAEMRSDVICLQEVETEQFMEFFEPEMAKIGYSGIFAPKSRAKTMRYEERKYVDGCAIFYRTSRFRLLKCHVVEFNQVAIAKAEGSQNMLNRVMTKDNIGLTALLETVDGSSASKIGKTKNDQLHSDKEPKDPEFNIKETYQKKLKKNDGEKNVDSISSSTEDEDGELNLLEHRGKKGPHRHNTINNKQHHKKTNKRTAVTEKDHNNHKGVGGTRQHKKSKKRKRNLLVVSTAHVHWDPEYSDVKIIQAMMIVHELKTFIRECYEEFVLGFGTALSSALTTTTNTIYGSQLKTSANVTAGGSIVLNNASFSRTTYESNTTSKDLSRSLSLKENVKSEKKLLLKQYNKEAEEVLLEEENKILPRKSPSHHENLKLLDIPSAENDSAKSSASSKMADPLTNLSSAAISKKKRTLSENALVPPAGKVNPVDLINQPGSDNEDLLSIKQTVIRRKNPYYHYKRYFERRSRRRRERHSLNLKMNALSSASKNSSNVKRLGGAFPKNDISEEKPATLRSPSPLVDILPLILCGDLNSLPDSGVLEFLLTGKLDADHCEFKDLGYKACLAKLTIDDSLLGNRTHQKHSNKVSQTSNSTPNTPEKSGKGAISSASTLLTRARIDTSGLADLTEEGGLCRFSHSFKLASAYNPSVMPYTNFTYDFCGVLDYTLHSRKFLVPIRILGPLDQNWINRNKIVGAPHPFIPSDHFPIVVEYDFKKI